MDKVTEQKRVWCSSPVNFANYKDAEPENRLGWVQLVSTDCTMAEYGWVEVGTAEVTYTFNPIDDGIAEAIAACDLAEAKLRSDLNDKLAEILDIRQRLLCLPSPKEPFDA